MNPVSEDVKDLLVTAGIGTFNATSGWGIFVGFLPDEPDSAIVIYDLMGRNEKNMDRSVKIEYDPIQIRIRGLGYLATYVKAMAIIAALEADIEFVLNGAQYLVFRGTHGPVQGERDAKERLSWIVTAEALRKTV